jgi:hypothetical protein
LALLIVTGADAAVVCVYPLTAGALTV